jgi:hypothetical protein
MTSRKLKTEKATNKIKKYSKMSLKNTKKKPELKHSKYHGES